MTGLGRWSIGTLSGRVGGRLGGGSYIGEATLGVTAYFSHGHSNELFDEMIHTGD